MNEATLKEVVAELESDIVGSKLGKFFVLGDSAFAVDLRPHDGRYLLVSALPAKPRLYLFKRSVKQLNRLKSGPSNFADYLRKRVSGSIVRKIQKEPDDRIVRFFVEKADDYGKTVGHQLIVQLTGRSSNVFLTLENGEILVALRRPHGPGQSTGDIYAKPERSSENSYSSEELTAAPYEGSISEGLDRHYTTQEKENERKTLVGSARSSINGKIKKNKRLLKKLDRDLTKHGDPDKWKRLGDLIKANISTAVWDGDSVKLIDYFDESLPEVELELEHGTDLSVVAEKYFKKYAKSQSAQVEIAKRIELTNEELNKLEARKDLLEKAIEEDDQAKIADFLPNRPAPNVSIEDKFIGEKDCS